jgi:carbonic anhydrase
VSAVDELVWKSGLHALGFGQSGHGHPATGVAVVACMDARLCVERLLDLRPGDAHVLRNAGGIVTDDMLRSLTLSQRLLGTREVMLIHHTDCGMTSFRDEELADAIAAEVGTRPPFALGAFEDAAEDVRRSIAAVRTCPFLPHREVVRGFLFDVETGRLSEVLEREPAGSGMAAQPAGRDDHSIVGRAVRPEGAAQVPEVAGDHSDPAPPRGVS